MRNLPLFGQSQVTLSWFKTNKNSKFKTTMIHEQPMSKIPCSSKSCNHSTPLTMGHHSSLSYHWTLLQIFIDFFPFWMIYNVTRAPSQALQCIFGMQSQRNNQKRVGKKTHFFKLQNMFFFIFFILIPPTSSMHNFLNFCSNWAI